MIEPSPEFARSFDCAPFIFAHRLAGHELFGTAALGRLAERLGAESSPRGYFILPDAKAPPWGSPAFVPAIRQAFDSIETSAMRLKLSSIHLEPEYGAFVRECARELDALTGGALLRAYHHPLATVFISSPGQITPYHVDSETNFLLQIRGTKTVHVYDGSDPAVVDLPQLERYWATGQLELSDDQKERGASFALAPGSGVHNPVHFPHWVHNGPEPSISLSLGFMSVNDQSDVLRVNHHLRRLGLAPHPPGHNRVSDDAKRALLRSARSVKWLLAGKRPPRIKLR
jgi:hypothetical protein